MKFYVNEQCIGCGLCASTCPHVFSMTEEGVAKAIETNASKDALETALQAKEECPVGAIEEVEKGE